MANCLAHKAGGEAVPLWRRYGQPYPLPRNPGVGKPRRFVEDPRCRGEGAETLVLDPEFMTATSECSGAGVLGVREKL
jgi:hypothetical protein